MGVPVSEAFPEVRDHNDQQAYEYMALQPGQTAADIPIEYIFIGSCTNGRLSDLQEAAAILKGQTIKEGVTGIIVPGSRPVRKAAEAIGLDKVFIDAGFEWREPGCSMCLGMNPDKVPEGVHCASTSNRNFVGRQGKTRGRTSVVQRWRQQLRFMGALSMYEECLEVLVNGSFYAI